MQDSVAYINGSLKGVGACFECLYSPSKGRIIRVSDSIPAGKVIYEGPLLHKVSEDRDHPIFKELVTLFREDESDSLDFAPMWYWCALNSLPFRISALLTPVSEEKYKELKMLYHPTIDVASETIRRVAGAVNRLLNQPLSEAELLELDRLTVIWTLNCFEYSDDPVTYASFFLPSFMSHSCKPTAMWTTIGETFYIRAQEGMQAGDELTVSYLSEEFALRPISKRRDHLQTTKFFTCDCSRCTAPVDDTRGFRLPGRLEMPETCFVRYPDFSRCACGCDRSVSLLDQELDDILSLETELVRLVTEYDGGEEDDNIPLKPDPSLILCDQDAEYLENLIDGMGPYHWASARGLMQLTEYYRSLAMYPKSIFFLKRRIHIKRKYIQACLPEMASTLAWALEDLADIILLHVSGSVAAGLSEQARERFCQQWIPRNQEDILTLVHSGAREAYAESVCILTSVFGRDHEHTQSARSKLDHFIQKLE